MVTKGRGSAVVEEDDVGKGRGSSKCFVKARSEVERPPLRLLCLILTSVGTLHLAQPTGSRSVMWVQFSCKPSGDSFLLETYQIDGDDPVELPATVSTEDTIRYIAEKSKLTVGEIREHRSVKVNMKMTEFETRISVPAQTQQHAANPLMFSSLEDVLNRMMSLQQQQAEQQQQLLHAISGSLSPKPRFELVRPEMFDGTSSSPQGWIDFYEYACDKNFWRSDEDKVKNLRLFLCKMAKSWYELRLLSHADDPWEQWKDSFLTSFQENVVDQWDRAIRFKYYSGSPLEYFFEKRKLLQMADASLPESSVVPLVIHGLPRELQLQVQVKAPRTVEALLQCCRELCIEKKPPVPGQQALGPQGGLHSRFGTGNWRQRGSSTNEGRLHATCVVDQLTGADFAPTLGPDHGSDFEKN